MKRRSTTSTFSVAMKETTSFGVLPILMYSSLMFINPPRASAESHAAPERERRGSDFGKGEDSIPPQKRYKNHAMNRHARIYFSQKELVPVSRFSPPARGYMNVDLHPHGLQKCRFPAPRARHGLFCAARECYNLRAWLANPDYLNLLAQEKYIPQPNEEPYGSTAILRPPFRSSN